MGRRQDFAPFSSLVLTSSVFKVEITRVLSAARSQNLVRTPLRRMSAASTADESLQFWNEINKTLNVHIFWARK